MMLMQSFSCADEVARVGRNSLVDVLCEASIRSWLVLHQSAKTVAECQKYCTVKQIKLEPGLEHDRLAAHLLYPCPEDRRHILSILDKIKPLCGTAK